MYCFNESDQRATPELRTNSSFRIDFTVSGFPVNVTEGVKVLEGTDIQVIDFGNKAYGVGTVERENMNHTAL